MKKLFLACALASLIVAGGAWAQDNAGTASAATANATPSKDIRKEADKRPKPKPTKKPRKPAPHSANP